MGLIKAAASAVSSSYKDMWKDYFVCDSLQDNVLMVKGIKKGSGLFDKNDVISNGSGIVVADGQCAIVVDDGIVVEVANEPGNYTFDTTKSPSLFDGGFKGIAGTFKQMVERFTYEGVTNRQQNVYYINTKEIPGNMYGTTTPIPFKVSDASINLNMQVQLRCNGEYSIRITNPVAFYKNVAGNVDTYYKETLDSQLKSELLTALQPAFAKIAEAGVRYSEVPAHVDDLAAALKEALAVKWTENRGIDFCNIGVNSVSMDPENEKKIRDLQLAAVNKDVNMATATLTYTIPTTTFSGSGSTL